jgi:hypothetical protein
MKDYPFPVGNELTEQDKELITKLNNSILGPWARNFVNNVMKQGWISTKQRAKLKQLDNPAFYSHEWEDDNMYYWNEY